MNTYSSSASGTTSGTTSSFAAGAATMEAGADAASAGGAVEVLAAMDLEFVFTMTDISMIIDRLDCLFNF
jgi:hypothetical protein